MLIEDKSVVGEEDEENERNRVENVLKRDKKKANTKSAFVPQSITALKSPKSLKKIWITCSKILGELNFLKQLINYFLSILKPITQKNATTTKKIKIILLKSELKPEKCKPHIF